MGIFQCKKCSIQYSLNDIASEDPKCLECGGTLEYVEGKEERSDLIKVVLLASIPIYGIFYAYSAARSLEMFIIILSVILICIFLGAVVGLKINKKKFNSAVIFSFALAAILAVLVGKRTASLDKLPLLTSERYFQVLIIITMVFGIFSFIFGCVLVFYIKNTVVRNLEGCEDKGYLVCQKCGNYYQLKPGESPDDFTDKCDCGGQLEYKKGII